MARRIGVAGAEGVHPTGIEPTADLGPLLGQEAAVLHIALGAGQVDGLVGGVVVASDKHRPPAAQALNAIKDGAVEVELVGDAAVVPLPATALGEIDARHHQTAEMGGDEAALNIEARLKLGLNSIRHLATVQRHAAVTGAPGRRERRLPALRRPHIVVELLRKGTHLLQRQHIGPAIGQEAAKPFAGAGTQTIDVPTQDAHSNIPPCGSLY